MAEHSRPVVLADDEPAVRKVACRLLKDLGYAVVECAHGGEAVETLGRLKGQARLLLTDLTMPVMSGAELVNFVRTRWPAVPVICMSGYPADLAELQTRLQHPCDVLVKPFEYETFARTVRAAAGTP